jgi:two-component system, NtrC family, response regulator AlgB
MRVLVVDDEKNIRRTFSLALESIDHQVSTAASGQEAVYLNFVASHTGKPVRTLSPAALEALRNYSWPGNLRELRNVIERAVILSDHEQIEIDDLSDSVHSPSEVRLGGKFTLEQIEAEHIRRLIASHKTLEEVAAILQIDPATLYRKRKRL